jgi:hypothetical protein
VPVRHNYIVPTRFYRGRATPSDNYVFLKVFSFRHIPAIVNTPSPAYRTIRTVGAGMTSTRCSNVSPPSFIRQLLALWMAERSGRRTDYAVSRNIAKLEEQILEATTEGDGSAADLQEMLDRRRVEVEGIRRRI